MATASFGKDVKLNNDMARKIAEAIEKPPKRVTVKRGSINSRINSALISKIK